MAFRAVHADWGTVFSHLPDLGCGRAALEQFLGGAAGLSAATVTRLTRQWQDDHAAFQRRELSDRVPPTADPLGDPRRHPRSLPHPRMRTHLLAATARSGDPCRGLVNRRQPVKNFLGGEAPADQARPAPVDADHESVPGGIGQYAIAPGVQGHGLNAEPAPPNLRCPLGAGRGRPEGKTSCAVRGEVSRASIVIPDKPDHSAFADVSEERRRLRTALTHSHRAYRSPPTPISLGVLRHGPSRSPGT